MLVLFLLMGVASFLYFAFLLSTSSVLSEIWIWLLIGGAHFFLAFLLKRKAEWKRKSVLFRIKVFCLTSYLIFFFTIFSIVIFLTQYKKGEMEKNLDYVLVIGCELVDNSPSETLRNRLDLAEQYARDNPNTRFVLVGGRGRQSASAESSVMFHDFLRNGISSDRLLMEFYSKNTKEKVQYGLRSIAHWKEELLVQEEEIQQERGTDEENYSYLIEDALEGEDRIPRVGILSSQYQLYHCIRFAEAENAYSYVSMRADTPPYLLPHYYTREAISLLIGRLLHQV
nr:YdcF family protein [uncultured Oribacterium sp.]